MCLWLLTLTWAVEGSRLEQNIHCWCFPPQDCPTDLGDFRAQQCSAHNDIKYHGVAYEWIPAPYDPAAPCALKCQARGRSLIVELAPKVLDGTRCRAEAFDMCISGVCQVTMTTNTSLVHVWSL